MAKECQKECRRGALQSQKAAKEAAVRARRLSKEVMVYWKRFEKVEKEHRKRAEKEAHEQRKMDLELREVSSSFLLLEVRGPSTSPRSMSAPYLPEKYVGPYLTEK